MQPGPGLIITVGLYNLVYALVTLSQQPRLSCLELAVKENQLLSIEILLLRSVIIVVNYLRFLADRTIGRAFGTVCRLSVVYHLSSVTFCIVAKRYVLANEGVNRKPGSKSSFLGSPPYFYFRFRRCGHRDGRFWLIFYL